MNWYQVFYWVTVADGVKSFFDAFSNFFMTVMVISMLAWGIAMGVYASNRDSYSMTEGEVKEYKFWISSFRKIMIWAMIWTTITWGGYIFCPSKKDAVTIIAGGAVGNFITSDSSARQIPAELTLLVREKMRSEIQELKSDDFLKTDTLASKTKEELIELLKTKK
jgi:hypothetical protein